MSKQFIKNIEDATYKDSYDQHHYTYIIINVEINKEYIGVKSCVEIPEENIGKKYFSSSHDKKFMKDQKDSPQNYQYNIIEEFSSRYDAECHEYFLHRFYDVRKNPKFYNRMTGVGGWNTLNKVSVKDKNNNTMSVDKDDPRYLSGELVSCLCGKISVKDKEGNTFQINKDDPRYLSGELVSCVKGEVTVKDKNGKMFRVKVDDPKWISGEYESINKNKITVKDKNGTTSSVNVNDPKYISGELTNITNGSICVNNKLKDKMISKNKINHYIWEGWKLGSITSTTKDKIWIHKNRKNTLISKNKINHYLWEGWKYGRFINTKVFMNNNKITKGIPKNQINHYLWEGWKLGYKDNN